MITGGYILQPRVIQDSDISVAAPCVREIWNFLLREANSQDVKYNGHEVKRGQLFRSYEDIREGTKWFVGWRKMMYSENHTKKAMMFLRRTGRIVTTKELGGVLITILKYDYYQDPKNYERTTKGTIEGTIDEPSTNQCGTTYNKNEKNEKNKKNKEEDSLPIKSADFIDQIIDCFIQEHGSYEILNKGKERAAVSKILIEYKKKYPGATSEETLGGLRIYFKQCVNISDPWLRNNMSPSIIVSKFNEINKILRNGTDKKTNGATVEQLATLLASKFGSDSAFNQ